MAHVGRVGREMNRCTSRWVFVGEWWEAWGRRVGSTVRGLAKLKPSPPTSSHRPGPPLRTTDPASHDAPTLPTHHDLPADRGPTQSPSHQPRNQPPPPYTPRQNPNAAPNPTAPAPTNTVAATPTMQPKYITAASYLVTSSLVR